jgi:hypothetical protein
MARTSLTRIALGFALLIAPALVGCGEETKPAAPAAPAGDAAKPADTAKPAPGK